MPTSFNSVDDLVFNVQLQVPQVSAEAVLRELRFALRKFCIDSEAWVEDIDITASSSTLAYNLTDGFDADVHKLKSVKLRREDSSEDFEQIFPLDKSRYYLSADYQIVFRNPQHLSGYENGTIRAKVMFRPRLNSGNVPTRIIERCAPGIIAGAAMALFMQPKKPWTDPNFAAYWKNEYNKEVSSAIANVNADYTDDSGGFSA